MGSRLFADTAISLGALAALLLIYAVWSSPWLQKQGRSSRRHHSSIKLGAIAVALIVCAAALIALWRVHDNRGHEVNGDAIGQVAVVQARALERFAQTMESRALDRDVSAATSGGWAWPVAVMFLAAVVALIWLTARRGQDSKWDKFLRRFSEVLAMLTALVTFMAGSVGAYFTVTKERCEAKRACESAPPPPSPLPSPSPSPSSSANLRSAKVAFPVVFQLGNDSPSGQDAFMESLVATLSACATDERHVQVRVVGYADANEFHIGDSVERNRELANRRATQVKNLPGRFRPPPRVEISLQPWQESSGPKMTESPRYFDAKALNQTGSADQGLLNRRVDLEIVDAGVCEPIHGTE